MASHLIFSKDQMPGVATSSVAKILSSVRIAGRCERLLISRCECMSINILNEERLHHVIGKRGEIAADIVWKRIVLASFRKHEPDTVLSTQNRIISRHKTQTSPR